MNSSCLICITNYEEKFTLLGLIEMKQRTRKIDKVFKNEEKPTALFQAANDILFVGTEKGKIEVLSLDSDSCVKKIDAHEGSEAGISVIQELKSPGVLITRSEAGSDKRFLITSTFDRPEFKIWSWDSVKCDLQPHIMITTSFNNGIRYILETSPEQLVCVDTHKTLKFYDFKHESEKAKKEQEEADYKNLDQLIIDQFNIADTDKSGYLEEEEATPFIKMILSNYSEQYKNMDPEQQSEAIPKLFDWMDIDKSGKVTLREFKSSL